MMKHRWNAAKEWWATKNRVEIRISEFYPRFLFDRIEPSMSIYPKNRIGFSEMFSPALFDVHLAMINEGNGAINGKLCSLYRQTGERAMGPVSKRVG